MDFLHSIYDCTIFALVAIIGYENKIEMKLKNGKL